MTERLPTSLFPDVTKAPLKVPQHKTLVNASGATYESLAVRVPVTAKPGPDEAIIQVATDTSLDKESMMLFRRVLFYMLNAAVPLCALVASWLVRRELAPLSRISKAAATIDGESLDTRLALNGLPTELHTLAMQFNHMLARLEATCDGLKQYADNIAHELRTPINRMRLDGNTKPGNSERLGLGLAITKSIVVLHGGTIAVESARGVGTKYTMTFPDHPEVPGLTFRSLDYETFPRRDLRDDEGAAKAAQ